VLTPIIAAVPVDERLPKFEAYPDLRGSRLLDEIPFVRPVIGQPRPTSPGYFMKPVWPDHFRRFFGTSFIINLIKIKDSFLTKDSGQ